MSCLFTPFFSISTQKFSRCLMCSRRACETMEEENGPKSTCSLANTSTRTTHTHKSRNCRIMNARNRKIVKIFTVSFSFSEEFYLLDSCDPRAENRKKMETKMIYLLSPKPDSFEFFFSIHLQANTQRL